MMKTSLVLLACSVVACAGGGGASPTEGAAAGGLHACDPLTAATKPIALGTVIAAGRATDGTVYLVDRGSVGATSDGLRIFVGTGGGALRRDMVAGSGEGPDFVSLTVGEATADLQVRIDLANGSAIRMGVFRGAPDPKSKSFDPSTQGEALTLLSPAEVGAVTVENIPAKVEVEYDAETSDGHRFFVVRPAIDWSYQDFRIFYGTPNAMIERKMSNASRGSSTYITFDVDGVAHDAYLPSQLASPGMGGPRLTAAGASQPLTLRTGSPGVGLTFQCL